MTATRQGSGEDRGSFGIVICYSLFMEIDEDKIDDAVLGPLWLTLTIKRRGWKGMDRSALDRLHRKGLIHDPVNRPKSVVLTDEVLQRSKALFQRLFTRPPQ